MGSSRTWGGTPTQDPLSWWAFGEQSWESIAISPASLASCGNAWNAGWISLWQHWIIKTEVVMAAKPVLSQSPLQSNHFAC